MNYFDPNVVVANLGLVGILFMIFAEIGLLIGLVLPGGDTLLFLSGLAASNAGALVFGDAKISAPLLFILAPIVAIIAGEFSYWTGAKYGRKYFDRPDGRYFNHENVVKAEKWLTTYGVGKALVLSKFVSVVRTLITPVCGVIGIDKKKFRFWNAVSGIVWTQTVIGLGYVLGDVFDVSISKYLLLVVLVIVAISLTPVFLEVLKVRRAKGPQKDLGL
jgi:membrane-associated protein